MPEPASYPLSESDRVNCSRLQIGLEVLNFPSNFASGLQMIPLSRGAGRIG